MIPHLLLFYSYRSLHLTVKNGNDQFMEVQIRTKQMHKESEESHWAYKERNLQEDVKKLVEQARSQVEGNSSLHHPEHSCAKLHVFIEDKNNKVQWPYPILFFLYKSSSKYKISIFVHF